MNCPSCGRPLTTGARKCVYCGHGTEFRPRPQLAIPPNEAPSNQRSSSGWTRWLFILILLALLGAGAHQAYTRIDGVRHFVDGILK